MVADLACGAVADDDALVEAPRLRGVRPEDLDLAPEPLRTRNAVLL